LDSRLNEAMRTTQAWVPQRTAADQLGVSERTLLRWRAAGLLQSGVHYRRMNPLPKSPLLYQLERCEQAMSAAFARDFRTLELVEA
jgi:predicted site-specific integrase-resolvase